MDGIYLAGENGALTLPNRVQADVTKFEAIETYVEDETTKLGDQQESGQLGVSRLTGTATANIKGTVGIGSRTNWANVPMTLNTSTNGVAGDTITGNFNISKIHIIAQTKKITTVAFNFASNGYSNVYS